MKRVIGLISGRFQKKNNKSKEARRASKTLANAVSNCFEQLEFRRMLSVGQPPVSVPGGPYTVNEGSSVILNGNGSSDPDGTITGYKWDFNYNPANGFHTQATGNPVSYNAADGPLTRTVALQVTDNDGNTTVETTSVTVNNVQPTITLTGAASVNEGTSYTLGWSKTDPGIDTVSGWDINWGDGTTHTTTAGNVSSATHTYTGAGERTITVTATDGDGTTAKTKDITVNTISPVVTLTGDENIDEGSTCNIQFSATDEGGTPLDGWSIDWGDGTVEFNDAPVTSDSHVYADQGEYTVTATASSTDGDTGSATLAVTVGNVAPSVEITGGPEGSSPEGTALSFGSNVSDPGDDTLTRGWTVKKGNQPYILPEGTNITSNTFSFTPTDNGSYTVRLTVQDEDQGSTTVNTESITITNVNPTASITGEPEGEINEGDSVTLTAHPSDVGAADEFNYSWSVKLDGEDYLLPEDAVTDEAEFTFTAEDDGTFVATCIVSDDDEGSVSASSNDIVANNVDPTGVIEGEVPETVAEGTQVNLTATPSDAGGLDTFTYAWSVKRNNQDYALPENAVTTEQNFSFTPNDEGTYVATCIIHDDDEGTDEEQSNEIIVTNANPTVTISGEPEGSIAEGDEINLTANATDPGTADELSYSWSVTLNEEEYDLGETNTQLSTLSFTTTDDGTYVATVTVTDGDEGGDEASSSEIVVTNLNPTVSITNAPETSPEGTLIELGSTSHDAGSADEITYAWSVKKGGEDYDLGETTVNASTFAFTPNDNGEYEVTLTIHDDDEGEKSDAVVINVTNVDPTATITGEPEGSIVEGTEVTLTATPSDAGADDFTYQWSVEKDGEEYPLSVNSEPASDTFTFVPRDNGEYVVTCIVSDDDEGSVSVESDAIIVTNANPTVSISGAPSSLVNSAATLPAGTGDTVTSQPQPLGFYNYLYAGQNGNQLWVGIMKWQLPQGLTAGDVDSATLVLNPSSASTITRQVNLYAYDSASSSVVSGDYAAANAATTVVASNILANTSQPLTINNAALVTAIKDAITNGRSYVTLAMRLENNTLVSTDLGWFAGPTHITPALRPTLSIGAASTQPVVEGSTTPLTATGADAGVDDELSYAWTVKKNNVDVDLTGQTTNESTFNFVPSDEGDYEVKVTVTDGDEGSTSETVNITATNAAPTGEITGAPEGTTGEGTPVTLTAEADDAGADTISYAWSVKKDNVDFDLPEGATVNAAAFTFTPPDQGEYVVTCAISDGDEGSATLTSTITVVNVAPTINGIIGLPTEPVNEGSPITVTADASDPGINDELTYTWDAFKNGTEQLTSGTDHGAEFTFTPPDNANYVIRLQVMDDSNEGPTPLSAPGFTVVNVNPTGAISGEPEESIVEGTEVTLTVDSDDAGVLDTHTFAWTVKKDGEDYPVSQPTDVDRSDTFSFTPRDNGVFVVTCVVTDNDEGSVELTSNEITVTNAAPTVDIVGEPEEAVVEGTPVELSVNVTDAGEDDEFTYSWSVTKDNEPYDLGEEAVTNQQNFTFTPNDEGTYVAKCDVLDDDEGAGTQSSADISATNANPTGSITGEPEESTLEGTPITLVAQASDVGTADELSYSWSVTKGEEEFSLPEGTDTHSATFTFTPDDNEDYVATCVVTDGDEGSVELTSLTMTVLNADPIVSIDGMPEGTVTEGASITVSANVTDPGTADTVAAYGWTVKKDGEDYVLPEGTNITSSEFSFTPRDNGSYVIRLTVIDDDEASTTFNSEAITVTNANPTASISGEPEGSIVEGTEVTLTAGANDAGTDDTHTFTWSVKKNGEDYPLSQEQVQDFQDTDTFSFTPNDEGDYVVTCVVKDDDLDSVTATSQTIVVTNANPTATITGTPEESVNEGTPITLGVDASDVGTADELSYSWKVYKGEELYDLGENAVTNEASFTFTPIDEGSYTATCTVTDGDEGTVTAETDPITVGNVNPTATITGAPEESIEEGDVVTLTANASDVGTADTLSYSWSVKKGGEDFALPENAVTNTAGFSFTPTDNGEYVATVVVGDGDEGSVEVSTETITVTNVKPVVSIDDMPEGGVEGTPITVSANVTDAGSADTVASYGWTVFKDEEHYTLPEGTNITSSEFTFTPTDNGSYVIRLTVIDDDESSTTFDSDPITVTNANPTGMMSGVPSSAINEGANVSLSVTPSDAGADDTTFTYSWSVKKGNASYTLPNGTNTTSASFSFVPKDNGTFTATCVITDKDTGSVSVASGNITVNNVNPTASISGAPEGTIVEGTLVSLTATANDAGASDTHTFAWTVKKDGQDYPVSTPAAQVGVTHTDNFSFTPNDNGSYVVTCVVTDDDSGTVTAHTEAITVTNADPSANISVPFTGVRGRFTEVNLSITDAGADSHSVAWNWGDGTEVETIEAGTNDALSVSHIFADTGTYTVTATVDDGDGGVLISEKTVTIKHAAMQPDPINPDNMALVVAGTNGNDGIKMILNANNRIKVTLNGASLGTFAPTGHIIAYGDAGHNVITLHNSIVTPAVIYGGVGRDIINGGSADDVIIGRPGNDALYGNGGRDIVIGGLGADLAVGGDGDDILITGLSSASESFNSLRSITAEWSSTETVFTDRVKHLKGSLDGGLNGGTKLTTGTVFEDNDADVLTGGAGRDWFFAHSTGETITDAAANDLVTDINT